MALSGSQHDRGSLSSPPISHLPVGSVWSDASPDILAQLAARVCEWVGHRLTLWPLDGGITNRNFRVGLDNEDAATAGRYVLRLGGNATHVLGIDRHVEYMATLMAASVGVGPNVVAFLEPEGYLVTRFINGRSLLPAEMSQPDVLTRIATALRQIHQGPPIPGRFSPFRTVEAYAIAAVQEGVSLPPDLDELRARARTIEQLCGDYATVPCHNDLLAGNFLLEGEGETARIRLLDWEYAGMGDPFFDLGNLAANQQLSPAASDYLLAAYWGTVTPERQRRLALMRLMSDFREGMWGLVQQGISQLDFDFVSYATTHLDRVRAALAREALSPLPDNV